MPVTIPELQIEPETILAMWVPMAWWVAPSSAVTQTWVQILAPQEGLRPLPDPWEHRWGY